MMRKRLGDERFLKMLAELRRRHESKVVTTEDLRALVKEFLPPKVSKNSVDLFFDNWIYSTGIPNLKLSYAVKGAARQWKVSGTIDQSGVDNDFTAEVPVEIQFAKGPSQIVWVETSDEPATFSATIQDLPAVSDVGARGTKQFWRSKNKTLKSAFRFSGDCRYSPERRGNRDQSHGPMEAGRK